MSRQHVSIYGAILLSSTLYAQQPSKSDALPLAALKSKPAKSLLIAGKSSPLPNLAAATAALTAEGTSTSVALNADAAVTAPVAGTGYAGIVTTAAVTVQTKNDQALTPQPVSTVEMTGAQILKSAGTFGDLPRFLQTLPGLIGGSDAQNASFVRGGNSFENLFVVDRIEVPNINHIALDNSTGGLGSMLDTEFIANASFHSGDMGTAFDSHMSSLTEIRTLELPQRPTYSVDLSYTGAGFRINRPVGLNKTFMFSARESVTNLLSDDIGLNGSPEFTNSFSKYTWDASSRDHFWVDSLSGRDNLQVRPEARDNFETNAYNTDYSGWRNTTGLVWQHTYASNAVGTWTVSNSQNTQNLDQRDQVNKNTLIFRQNTSAGVTNAKYQYMMASASGLTSDMGVDLHMNRIAFDQAQPAGQYSPYSASSTPQEAFSASPKFNTLDRAAYYNVTANAGKKVVVKAGMRWQGWGYDSSLITGSSTAQAKTTQASVSGLNAFLPQASVSFLASRRVNFRASFARYAELPPYATIASQPANASLGLIHSQHLIAGGTVSLNNHLSVGAEAYRKTYTGYPVALLYPQVSLASLLPTIIQPFTLMQMASNGKGTTQGVEISYKQTPWHHIFTEGNVSFSHALFTGNDGIYRSGSSDLPVVANLTGGINVKRFVITMRNTTTSGRPYTPLLAAASLKQNRAIYDLTKLNSIRGNLYNRLDFAVNREVMLNGKVLRIHGGLMNVLNRENFYESLWRPRCPKCGAVAEPSMGIQPDFGMSYTF
jgi:hypothetical protein